MDGQDVVYKDVIEPLESVSVSLVPTEKADVTEFGEPKEVAFTLADKVLTAPSQEVTLINVGEVGASPPSEPPGSLEKSRECWEAAWPCHVEARHG